MYKKNSISLTIFDLIISSYVIILIIKYYSLLTTTGFGFIVWCILLIINILGYLCWLTILIR